MSIEELDLDDDQMIAEWFDHPNTVALHDDLGRAFRSAPSEFQRREIESYLAGVLEHLAEARRSLATTRSSALARIVEALEDHAEQARRRLSELEGP